MSRTRIQQIERALLAILAVAEAATAASAQSIAIEHEAVGCVIAEAFPRIEARLNPSTGVSRARVYFRGSGEAWYFVEMKPSAGSFSAALPKPKRGLKQLGYYIEAMTREFESSRTPDFTSDVQASEGDCGGKRVAAIAAVSSVAVAAPGGAPAVPLGFSASGLTAPAGAVGAGTAAAGGGHATAIVIGVGAAGAVAGGAVALKKLAGDDGTVVLRGYVYVGECTCTANRPPPYPYATAGPIPGAVVSTTLNSTTATTDAEGRFELRTTDPNPRGTDYVVTITATGCSTATGARGGHSSDPSPFWQTLVCSYGPPSIRPCSCSF